MQTEALVSLQRLPLQQYCYCLLYTSFVQEEEDIFRRFTETHLQRGYTAEQMRALLEQAGLKVLEIMDSDTGEAATATSERVYIVAKEQQKELPTERYVK